MGMLYSAVSMIDYMALEAMGQESAAHVFFFMHRVVYVCIDFLGLLNLMM